jgi:tripartite-type tricarboxylate transporter receptor subunit TctC
VVRTLLALLLLSFGSAAWTQSYPSKPVRIVVPFGVGGSADVYARYLGAKLQDSVGQSFVVENRPGGGSIVGSDVVAKSDPDGYTLLMMSNTHTVNETLIPKKPFELMRDFAPITGVSYSDLIMVVHPSVQAASLKEFIALAKSKPGALNYASSGNGTPYHMAGELFKSMAGVDIVHVPHKGSDQARVAVMGGQVQMMFDAVPTMAANAKAGKVKAFGTTGEKRSSVTPELPTLSEAGVAGYETGLWLGLMAPAGTPRPILERLNSEVNKLLNSAEVKQNWAKQGTITMGMSIDQFDKFLRQDIQKWSKLVKSTGMKVD